MDRVKKDRTAMRAKLTRLINQANLLLRAAVSDKDALQVKFEMLMTLGRGLEEVDAAIRDKMLDEDADDGALETEQQASDQYQESYLTLKIKLQRILEPPATPVSTPGFQGTASANKRTFQLPKIKPMTFDGDYKSWLTWWAQFKKIHEDQDLDLSDKSHYLLDAMKDGTEARALVLLYLQSSDNYNEAVEALKECYGRDEIQQQYYIRQLLSLVMSNVASKEKLPLGALYLQLESHLRCLYTLKLDQADPATWLFPMVESSLSEDTMWAWQRSSFSKQDGKVLNPPKTRLDLLMDFIKGEVRTEQQIAMAQTAFQSSSSNDQPQRNKDKDRKAKAQASKKTEDFSTAAGLIAGELSCGFCDGRHDTDRCVRAQGLTYLERKDKLKSKNLCFSCLYPFHPKKPCKVPVKCILCGKPHHTLMCQKGGPSNKKTESEEDTEGSGFPKKSPIVTASTANVCSGDVLLNILQVKVIGKKGKSLTVRMVGDSGCQRSYITEELVKNLQLKEDGNEYLQNVLFGNIATPPILHKRITVPMASLDGRNVDEKILLQKKQICGALSKVPYGPWIDELRQRGIQLTDLGDGCAEVDILLGSDKWNSILIKDERDRVNSYMTKCGLLAVETIFGWTLSGPVPVSSNMSLAVTSSLLSVNSDIAHMWSLESIGIKDPIDVKSKEEEEKEAMDHFRKNVSRDQEGRYVVGLPWKSSSHILPTNRQVAEKRLVRATATLKKMEKFAMYDAVFRGWEQEAIISEVEEDKEDGHYLPHRPVFKESATTPVRPVFDASCKVGKHPSLNDCLFKGPNLLELIPSILLRFRENNIGVSADIRKAFQMIRVREEDRKFQKFLWWSDESCSKLKVYQHERVVFGMNCSPFLLAATINLHLEETAPDMKEAILYYVDNLANSVKTEKDYVDLKRNATLVMKEAGMELRQWARTCGEEPDDDDAEDVLAMLGLNWNRRSDELSCVIPMIEDDGRYTKKKVLSLVARVFDPIGFLAPALVPLKSIIQDSWATDLGWDEVLPEDTQKKIAKWISTSSMLGEIAIPRHFQYNDFTKREIHVFVDASSTAYAGVIFIRTELMGAVNVQLILAKSRLAPRKKAKGCSSSPTIPRLELMACVIGTRLVSSVRAMLDIHVDEEFYWSDSTTALAWIRRNDQWGTFVGNRVEEVRKIADRSHWRHVPGTLNPADLPSRGCGPKELLESSWWEGPAWMKGEKSTWPNHGEDVDEEAVTAEVMKTAVMVAASVIPPRFSSYRRNVAVTGWVLRFITNSRGLCRARKRSFAESKNVVSRYLTVTEMRAAERAVLQQVQSESFPDPGNRIGGMMVIKDSGGLLRVQSRLINRKDKEDFLFPIVLPKNHPMVDLLILDVHRYYGHAGIQLIISKIREKYWILSTRRTVRRVLKECSVCRRYQSKPCEVIPSALPEGRVMECEPFQTTGVDLFGPMYLKDGTKVWGVIFTCAYYRGVYLDLVNALSTEAFMMALERFIALHGRPNTVYSDNGTNFHGTANVFASLNWKEIEDKMNVSQIQWTFNPPSGAWWGGFWERLIRSVKDLLKRIIGTSRLEYDELRTCLAGVGATINDRPLTVVTEDNDDLQALTPSMFLKRRTEATMPETGNAAFLQKGFLRMKAIQQQLQERFRREYISLLVQRRTLPKRQSISEGAVVLVGAENKKRFQWPLGVVLELIPGRDGEARVARIKTSKGILDRPLQRLYPLELDCQDIEVLKAAHQRQQNKVPSDSNKNKTRVEEKTSAQRVVVTKRGRVIRTPARYGAWLHLVKE